MDCAFHLAPTDRITCVSPTASFSASDEPALPAEVLRILSDETHPQVSASLYDLGLAMEPDVYCMCWKTTSGEGWYEANRALHPSRCVSRSRLARFIKNVCNSDGSHTSRTTFGPNASGLEEHIIGNMRRSQPTAIALGVGGAYAVLYDDGTLTYDLGEQYPLFQALIVEARAKGGIKYVALNPFVAGEYYAVQARGGPLPGPPLRLK
ncbi:hypothetical protein MSAN_02273700 [Mycena sanguinolenta]|uniref:Uncharacterized protein n=1 Tax=Mycena sanguinolenta TaxID=230812 RepID=A0A8H7CJ17_9AGAR|nr:hypothetical protein MSAN_02273700 [Mycena sanguinolenta]